jgi:hypothetical protein
MTHKWHLANKRVFFFFFFDKTIRDFFFFFFKKKIKNLHEGEGGFKLVAPQILIVLFLIYLFDNIIQLISLRSLWYYGGW